MKTLTVYGTRGSFPVENPEFVTFGGATSCYLFSFESADIMVDCGSGAAQAGERLKALPSLTLLITHPHLDHICGIVTLTALLGGKPLRIVATDETRRALCALMSPPFWPVPLAAMENVTFYPLRDRMQIGGVTVRLRPSNHVGGTYLYRLTEGATSVVTAFDFNHADGYGEILTDFARDCSLMLYDGSMTEEEYKIHSTWGHSVPAEGVKIAKAAGARKLLITHHGTNASDEFLLAEERALQADFPNLHYARAGSQIEI